MPNYYTYFISSLPLLRYGERRPFSFNHFLSLCRSLIPKEDAGIIEMLKNRPIYDYSGRQETLNRWRNYEVALRNELVRIRASRRHVDASPYLRSVGEPDISLNHVAINAYRAANPLESERMLDEARWQALEEFSLGHYFDIDIVIIYAFKLIILEKWETINSANNAQTLETMYRSWGLGNRYNLTGAA